MERSASTLASSGLTGEPQAGGTQPAGVWGRSVLHRSTLARHALLLACYLTAGVALTWPRALYLAGRLPATRDSGGYVWGFWWVAQQVSHAGNPWFTTDLAAPVGAQLAYHTLMPLPGLLMTPVTLVFGPSATYNLLSIACPGLLCYAMYRAARLWLPTVDAIAAGAFFGLSYSLAWRSWYEVNLALGAVFLPMALEAAVRLSRRPGPRRAVVLGVVVAAALLTDQESAVLAVVLAGLALLPWLWRQPTAAKLGLVLLAGAVAVVAASPQIIAMAGQSATGGASIPRYDLTQSYVGSGSSLVQLFAPSPRLAGYGLGGLASFYYKGRAAMVVTGYGTTLTLAALAGLAVAWRRRAARLLGMLWLGCSLLALGPVPWIYTGHSTPLAARWHNALVSMAMPYTWFVRIPGLANFREADRFTALGLVPAALLAGAMVGWLRTRAKPTAARGVLAVLLALAALEAGWSGNPAGHRPIGAMPTAMPRLDGPIAADHSGSIVVDVPFGIRGGLPVTGGAFPPETMVLATADGHPLADAFVSRIPRQTLDGIRRQPFYAALMNAQGGPDRTSNATIQAARRNAQAIDIGWVLDWTDNHAVSRLLQRTGFTPAYRVGRVTVYRSTAPAAHHSSGVDSRRALTQQRPRFSGTLDGP
ncbi:MAG TPA: hypothetical protein VGS19_19595 [Streptosporangiaceae bacterium]|nr:hypothetical protein [Streptosporangiaceae bacterium]